MVRKIKKASNFGGFLSCTEGGNRTRTLLPELDFESSASTNSATSAALVKRMRI